MTPTWWRAAAVVVSLAAVTVSLFGVELESFGYLALGLALIVGVPHGALDVAFLSSGPPRRRVFGWMLYVGIVVAVLGLWQVIPGLLTAGFLALAVWHFGEGDLRGLYNRHKPLAGEVISRGLMVVGGPILVDWEHARPILETLAGADLSLVPSAVAPLVGLALVLQHLPWLLEAPARQRDETMLVAAMFIVLPALISFALYFALWHAPSHVKEMRFKLDIARRPATRWLELGAGLVGVVTVIGAAALADVTVLADGAAAAAIEVVAALTVPHALLVERWRTAPSQ